MYFIGAYGHNAASLCLKQAKELGLPVRGVFFKNGSLTPYTKHYPNNPLKIPFLTSALQINGVLRTCTAIVWLDKERITPFTSNYQITSGVGRWHRPNSMERGDSFSSFPSNVGPGPYGVAIASSPSEEAMQNICRDYIKSGGSSILVLKGHPLLSDSLGQVKGWFTPTPSKTLDIKLYPFTLQPITTKYFKVIKYQNNVISELDDDCVSLDRWVDDTMFSRELFIRTRRGGKVAKVMAGDPTKGLFSLYPLNFNLDEDDLEIEFCVKFLNARKHFLQPGLTLCTDHVSLENLNQVEQVTISDTAIVQLGNDEYLFSNSLTDTLSSEIYSQAHIQSRL